MGPGVTARGEGRIICQQAEDQQWGPRSVHMRCCWAPEVLAARSGRVRLGPDPELVQTLVFDNRPELQGLEQSTSGGARGPVLGTERGQRLWGSGHPPPCFRSFLSPKGNVFLFVVVDYT